MKQFADFLTQRAGRDHNSLPAVRFGNHHEVVVHSIEHAEGRRGVLCGQELLFHLRQMRVRLLRCPESGIQLRLDPGLLQQRPHWKMPWGGFLAVVQQERQRYEVQLLVYPSFGGE
jgi:hypothetical protein